MFSYIVGSKNDINCLTHFHRTQSRNSYYTSKLCTEQHPYLDLAIYTWSFQYIYNYSQHHHCNNEYFCSGIRADFLNTQSALILKGVCHQQGYNQRTAVFILAFYELCRAGRLLSNSAVHHSVPVKTIILLGVVMYTYNKHICKLIVYMSY